MTEREWTSDEVALLVQDCVKATRARFHQAIAPDNDITVTDEVAGFMQGFAAGRGFTTDITDALLVALNFR